MSDQITLLKFTASWCYPCKLMKPIIAEFKKLHPHVIVREIDVDTRKGDAEANTFHVKAMPTMIMLKNDQKVWRTTGMCGLKALENALKKATSP